ncbi:DUF3862 domain-containing protein [Companilactobacillus versmoldensis]|uniref:DUF3862 domain-containing protein n=1 Tax=Companilactobacillus versmoldensis TaxID=194326 RepID=UPI000249261B|nr:DUF3862 domain-containing protein [Companilactobacillus versmoldensis]
MGRQYKAKKPLLKRWWFWVIAVFAIIFVLGNLAPESTSGNNERASNSKTVTEKKETKSDKEAGITEDQYNSIQIGDNGDSKEKITSMFGSADSTSNSSIGNTSSELYIWNDVAGGGVVSNVSVSFINNLASSKSISGLKVDRKKISLADFNSIQNGQSEDDVINILGKPNSLNESSIMGTSTKILSYTSNISGDLGANFNVTISDGAVSGKSQASMS